MTQERSRRGFATLPPDKRRVIARMGGRTAHAKGVAHTFTSEEGRAAGRKGGAARRARCLARFLAARNQEAQ